VAEDTLYELLGVPDDASTDQIKSAYRRLSKTYHPDRGGTAAFFRQLQDAHETLSDPLLRAEYDRSLKTSSSAPPPPPPPPPQEPRSRSTKQDEWRNPTQATENRASELPALSRFMSAWSRTINSLASMSGRRGRRRQEFVTITWIVSVILMLVVVVALLQAAKGLLPFLLVGLGIFWWRRHKTVK
jgi:curved DNA-binding protein CbpA